VGTGAIGPGRSRGLASRVSAGVVVAGLLTLATARVTEVATLHLGAPFDLALERPGANTILLLRQGVPI